MKFCYNCGAEIEEGDKFCVECGAELSLVDVEDNQSRKTNLIALHQIGMVIDMELLLIRKGIYLVYLVEISKVMIFMTIIRIL